MLNNCLSVLYKHIIQLENKNVGLKVGVHKHTIAPLIKKKCVCVGGGGGALAPFLCVCVHSFLSILVLRAIFEMGTIFMTRPPPSLISALFFIVCLCAFCFSTPVVVTIFVRRTIFMNCPPASHSMWCFFVVSVHFLGSIIEL